MRSHPSVESFVLRRWTRRRAEEALQPPLYGLSGPAEGDGPRDKAGGGEEVEAEVGQGAGDRLREGLKSFESKRCSSFTR